LIAYVLLIYFKQTLIQEKEDKKIKQLPSIDSASPQKPSSLQKEKNSRLPEYGLVALLGSKLKNLWKISVHWLACNKNLLFYKLTRLVHK